MMIFTKLEQDVKKLVSKYDVDDIYDIILKYRTDNDKKFTEFFLNKYNDTIIIEKNEYEFFFQIDYYNKYSKDIEFDENIQKMYEHGMWVFCIDKKNKIFYYDLKEIESFFTKYGFNHRETAERIIKTLDYYTMLGDYSIENRFNI